MATWQDLETELSLWQNAGERPTFWWRDDDAEAPTSALDQLIAITKRHSAPLHLAVIPVQIDPGLAGVLRATQHVWSMQHGFAHVNNEPKGERASEVGKSRALSLQMADLRMGWERMQAAELPKTLPIFVPPWNRIGDQVVPHLADWGYAALSGFGPRSARQSPNGLRHFNGHVEPLRWRPDARFAGTEKTLEQCVSHLYARRIGDADQGEATGLVTHHLQTPPEVWDFCDAFAERLGHQNRAQWIALDTHLKGATHG